MAVEFGPAIRRGPCSKTFAGQRKRWRAEAEHVQHQRFAVTLPAIRQKSTLGHPGMGYGYAAVLGPLPVHAKVELLGEFAYLSLRRTWAVEIRGGGESTDDKDRRVNRRQLAHPGTAPRIYIEKVVVEPAVPGRVGIGALRTVPQEPQRRERALDGSSAIDESTLDADRIG